MNHRSFARPPLGPFLCGLCSVVLFAIGLGRATAEEPESVAVKIHQRIERLPCVDSAGKPFSWESVAPAKAIAVVFLCFDCPVSNNSIEAIRDLAKQYADQGLAVIGIVPEDSTPAQMKKWTEEFRLSFPLYRDPKLLAVDALKATTTPEAFVLDGQRRLRYRGRIDDAYSARLKRNPIVQSHDLKAAVDAVLAGKDVSTPITVPVGCPIEARVIPAQPGADPRITFHKAVAPILQQHCQECHRPGQVGPFPLLTYAHAVRWAEDIRAFTASREMPPWKPRHGLPFQNDRRMTEAEIATIARWVDAGCPEGNPADAPPPRTFPEGWKNGPPDLILTVEEDFHLGATGSDVFRCFVLPTGLTEDKFIVGYEVQPGNPRVVHHTLNFWDRTGKARELAEAERKRAASLKEPQKDFGPGYTGAMGIGFFPIPSKDRPEVPPIGSIGGWAPGQQPVQLPAGHGWLLPRGADLVIQTHYHRTGKPETNRLRIGLYFAKKPVVSDWQSIVVAGIRPSLFQPAIPAGASDHAIRGSVWLKTEATIHNVMPHMHLIGKSVRMTLTQPGQEPITLVDIPRWDYNWQETYWFREPLRVPVGTRIDIEAVYDNSLANPNNPFNPPKNIYFGEQTTNEMLFGFLGVTPIRHGEKVRVTRTEPK